jgi:hypothetical protein
MFNGAGDPGWGQVAEYSFVSFTPSQGFTGAGGLQRRSPVGGAANGIPWKTRRPSCRNPETEPASVFTTMASLFTTPASGPFWVHPARKENPVRIKQITRILVDTLPVCI